MRKLTEQDINGVISTINSNYTIKKARVKGGEFSDSDHYGIVLAQNKNGDFVTWQFHLIDEIPSFYWGHYHMNNETAAIDDFETRG